MKLGLFISLLLHGSILAWALITLQSTKPAEPPKRAPIVVDLATISEVTKLKQGAKAKPKKKAEKKPPVKTKPPKKVSKPQPQKTAALPPPKAEPPKPDPIEELLKKKPTRCSMLAAGRSIATFVHSSWIVELVLVNPCKVANASTRERHS